MYRSSVASAESQPDDIYRCGNDEHEAGERPNYFSKIKKKHPSLSLYKLARVYDYEKR